MGPLYTVEQAAALLQFKPWSVRQWVRAGKLGAVKLGGEWRIREQASSRSLRRHFPSKNASPVTRPYPPKPYRSSSALTASPKCTVTPMMRPHPTFVGRVATGVGQAAGSPCSLMPELT
jgi:excisionase family DNA binding protein